MISIVTKTRLRMLAWGACEMICNAILGMGILFLLLILLKVFGASAIAQRSASLLFAIPFAAALVLAARKAWRFFWRRHHLCLLLEERNRGYQNALSTVDYLRMNAAEIRALGYSPDLIEALKKQAGSLPDPDWSSMGLNFASQKLRLTSAIFALLVSLPFFLFQTGFTNRMLEDVFASAEYERDAPVISLTLPERFEAPLHATLVIPATDENVLSPIHARDLPPGMDFQLLQRRQGGAWKLVGEAGGASRFQRIRVEAEEEIALIGDKLRSSVCRIQPVFPPAVESMAASIAPPEYARKPKLELLSPPRIEAMEGSRVDLNWRINHPLSKAAFEILSATGSLVKVSDLEKTETAALSASFNANSNIRLRLRMTDHYGQQTLSVETPVFIYEDSLPQAKILSPSGETILKDNLRIPLEIALSDDVAIAEAALVHRVESESVKGEEIRQTLYSAGDAIPEATSLINSPSLDLTEASLWPGDAVIYWIEVRDWRGPGREGLIGRSETRTARFPSVDEIIDERAAMRSETTDSFNELMQEQREISRQFQEMRQDMQAGKKTLDKGDSNWETKKKLEETLKRQEDVQKKIADVAQKFEDSLKRLEEENDISLRTLQKFEQVQELLDKVLSDESKQVLKELRETLKNLENNQLRPEEMEQTESNLADFEKQLDRQLELLKNMWLEQETEALKEQAEDLAKLQEELRKATEELQKKKDPSALEDEPEEESELSGLDEVPKSLEDRLEEMLDQAEEELEKQRLADKEQEAKEGKDKQSADQAKASEPEKSDAPESSEQKAAESPSDKKQEQTGQKQDGSEQSNPKLSEEEKTLADRQEQINKETESLLEELKRLKEKAEEQNPQLSENFKEVEQSKNTESLNQNQKSALSQMKKGDMAKACKKQSRAKKNLDQLAESLGGCCGSGGSEEEMEKMMEVLERAFILSEIGEKNDQEIARFKSMPTWPNPERMSQLGRQMGLFKQEATRLSVEYRKVSEKNPFADYSVVEHLDQAARGWRENTRSMEEDPPTSASIRAHMSLGYVNLAIEQLIESMQQSQSMSSSSSSSLESYFKDLKKMLQQQKQLNKETNSLKEMMEQGNQKSRIPDKPGSESDGNQPQQSEEPSKEGDAGEQGAGEQLKKMAEQQRNLRRQLEELEKKYKEEKSRAGSLEGVGDLMQESEKKLDHQRVDNELTDIQKKIEQRLLDAERSLHEKGFKKQRKALRAEGDAPEAAPDSAQTLPEERKEESLARLLRENLDGVSPQWRERIRSYYDNLLKLNAN